MSKTKQQKQEILAELKDKLGRTKSLVLAKFNALGVKDNEDLRKELRKENGEYYTTKKTLLNLALKDTLKVDFDPKDIDGQMAIIFGYGDEVSPAKVVDKFISSHEGKLEFTAGILEGKLLSAAEVKALAKLPSKQELYAKLVGSINAPVSGFVNVLAGNLRGLVTVLKAIGEKK